MGLFRIRESGEVHVGADEARALVNTGAMLIDVRETSEWRAGHAPGASHIPLMQLAGRVRELPRDRAVVCVCRSGSRSSRAVQMLRNLGFDARNLAGGMAAWATAGHEVIADSGQRGYVV